jgi:hypothetical protein
VIHDGIVPDLNAAAGVRLTAEIYREDLHKRRWLADGVDCWKLERAQHFTEAGFASWDAFAAGEWGCSMELYEALRPELTRLADEQALHRSHFHRVRVVEEPLCAYMLWELHCFRVRAERSETIRIISAGQVADLEAAGPLPELVVVCGQTLYQVVYTGDGVPDGAIRFTDPGVVAAHEEFIRSLFDAGEEFASYFERAVAPLPVPGGLTVPA